VLQSRSWAPAWLAVPRSLTSRTLLLCSVLVTCGFFIFCSIVLLDAREDAARQAEQAAWNIVALVEQDVARNIELLDQSLQAVNDGLQLPGIWDFNPQVRNMLLFDHLAQARYLGFVNALNESGDVIADSQSATPRGGNFAGRDYFIAHRHDPRSTIYIGRPFANTPDQPGSIPISRRMSHPDGTFGGVVVGSIKLAYFRDLFARLDVGPHGSITLIRTDGTILMRMPYDANDIGRTIGSTSVFYQFMRTREPRIEAESQVDHVLRRFNYKQIDDLPLVLSVGFAVDDIFAAWRVKATGILLLVAVLCLANVGLTVLLRRQLLQRAAAETAARGSEAEFRRLTENVSDIVAQIDDDGVYRYVSPASLRVLGVAPEALIGRRLADDLHPDDRAGFELWLARLQHGAVEPTTRFRKRRADGSEVWIEAAASRLIDPATGTPQGFVILSRDVTARHLLDIAKAERACELEQNNAQLATLAEQRARAVDVAERAVAAKSRFLATMSHEVRTPLNSILGYAELLALEGNLDPVQAARLAAMRGAGTHLRDVVNHVLDYSQVEAEAAQSTPVRTDLPALIEQCRAQIEPAAAMKGLRFICDVAPGVPDTIVADGIHLRQVLINLLQNAVKYTRHGQVALHVSGGAACLRCAVADTGVGIPADQRDRLFHEYERLDADQAGIEGTGLGLTIAAQLVKGMGGRIGYDDNPGGGAVFWLEVPIGTLVAEPPPAPPRHVMAPRSLWVLVVDDSAANRDVAASFLRGVGHVVTEASGGEEAVRLVDAQDFDVVLMDMRMPRMDGLETTRRIRALPGGRGCVPIIAVTAQVLDNQWTTWRAAGVDEYLAKPYERAELLTVVTRAASPAAIARAASPPPPGMASEAQPPRAADDTLPVFDPDIIAQLDACMPPEKMVSHLATLAADIETLLALLPEDACAAGTEALAAIAHKVAGDGGQLGFLALAAAARRYEAAWQQDATQLPAPVATLRDRAATALAALRQRRDFMRRAAMSSAKLP
jgi:PAS domain S-box-containing protein